MRAFNVLDKGLEQTKAYCISSSLTKLTVAWPFADEGLGGDPELEAADRANQGAVPSQEEGSDEDEWTPKDAKDLAKKQKQMAKSGITFTSKVGPEAKVELRRL